MEVTVMKIGEDFQICLAGGKKPHIGCVVQAVPRGIADRRRELECDFLGMEPHRT